MHDHIPQCDGLDSSVHCDTNVESEEDEDSQQKEGDIIKKYEEEEDSDGDYNQKENFTWI